MVVVPLSLALLAGKTALADPVAAVMDAVSEQSLQDRASIEY
jgi:hypothetical protein